MTAEEQKTVVEETKVEDAAMQAKIEKALQDPTKKRKAEDEIEIDINSSVPLSKKQKRMLRRGKVTLEELNAKYNIDASSISEFQKEQAESKKSKTEGSAAEGEEDDDAEADEKKKVKKEQFGVWIGNMSFDTTKEDLIRFIKAKTKDNENEEERVEESDIVRVKLPLASNEGKQVKNKGFCYMDFDSKTKMLAVVKLSENQLNGRNLLIKNSKSFEGRPDKNDLVASSKNPPSRILFVGNLSFDTTDEVLRKHFQHCGEITKIRMATFQDSGKCKGFAFVDFKEEAGATKALKDKSVRKLALRPIRMEYGEDRSKRQVRKRPDQNNGQQRDGMRKQFDIPNEHSGPRRDTRTSEKPRDKPQGKRPSNNYNKAKMGNNNRLKSSIALASAQRGSAAIVPSEGKKVKFD